MTIKLFNTLTKQKENFVPQDTKKVTMYVDLQYTVILILVMQGQH